MSLVGIAREALALQEMAIKLKEQRDGLIQVMFTINQISDGLENGLSAMTRIHRLSTDAIRAYSETVKVER